MPTQPQPSCEVARLALAAYNHGTIMQHRRDVFYPQARRCISSVSWGNAFTGGENEGCPMPQQTSHCPLRDATAFHFPAPCLMEGNAWTHNT
jgi:hypothetical protein